jgi:hypothetical protein
MSAPRQAASAARNSGRGPESDRAAWADAVAAEVIWFLTPYHTSVASIPS